MTFVACRASSVVLTLAAPFLSRPDYIHHITQLDKIRHRDVQQVTSTEILQARVRNIKAMAEVIIRKVRQFDCKLMKKLMQESAEYQKFPLCSIITTSELEEDGWGSFPAFEALVAEDNNGLLVGYALYYYTYSTWEGRSVFMDDLYVTSSHRYKGIGFRLCQKFIEIVLDVKCARWNLTMLKSNTQAIAFFEGQGAVNLSITEGWDVFRMNKDAMEAFLNKAKTIEGVKIRAATAKDCVGIRKLIQDLADYEKMPEGPQIDDKKLQEDCFGEIPFYKVFVAEDDDILVGYVLFFYTYSLDGRGVYMEDLYVSPSHRGRGIGSALWRKVVQCGMSVGGCRCDFSVLNWNASSIEFYKLKGATNLTSEKGHQMYRIKESIMKKFVRE
nr:uncharacterized protein LOC123767925 isoform X1 [Procambarus clarkii]